VSLFDLDTDETVWRPATAIEVNPMLTAEHYLGPIVSGGHQLIYAGIQHRHPIAIQVWRTPTSRRLPNDGTWWELSRWCLRPTPNLGSTQHGNLIRHIKRCHPEVTTLVSYSDPSVGHTGALYRACNWRWAPTWHRLRPPPTGNGEWTTGDPQSVKDRWVFLLGDDERRPELLSINDASIRRRITAGTIDLPHRLWNDQ